MEHILDLERQKEELYSIFRKIQESNTILFLGAGASVGEKMYLSREIINYYESYLGYSLNETNITKFIDILSANHTFSRRHFDGFVYDLLQKYKITESHKILASIPWREIITTNFDLLVEKAFDEVSNTHLEKFTLKPIRSIKQYNYKESNSEVKYIKLNGCMVDISLYPLAFSTDDFKDLKPFYKLVLNDLKNLSPEINFLSIGYSFSDSFGQDLLSKFDQYNFREQDKKWIINVDPFPNINALDYYKKNRIAIIKCSFQEFFLKYQKWEEENNLNTINKRGITIRSNKDYHINIPSRLLINLDGSLRQLNTHTKEKFIKENDFFMGEEPTFNLITRGVDVIKSTNLSEITNLFDDIINKDKFPFIPILFIIGDFGIGKSTFSLRLIYELEKNQDLDLIAFELTDFQKLRKEDLISVIYYCKSKTILLYSDDVEIESNFKSLIELQRDLSIEQFQNINVIFLVSIRENIFEKFKLNSLIPNINTYKINGSMEYLEISELLDKLNNYELIHFRDEKEKRILIDKIQKDYDSDSYISLMSIITSGKHENDLISCYNQLSEYAQQAFLYTALLHQHKILMPASWLKQNISMTWDDFIIKVIKAEGKGILLQEERTSYGTQPDLFFRTKHPIIAHKLVEKFIPNKDIRYFYYDKMLKSVEIGQTNSYIVNNLLKSLQKTEEYSIFQINKLFDAALTRLGDDPYFLLNYSINLQNRNTKKDLKKGIELITYAEGLLEFKNHRFIHRRAVLNFELAKIYFKEETKLNFTLIYLNEAKELFQIKRVLDPFSSYSYVDFIKLQLWELESIVMDKVDEIQKQIFIDDLFDIANKSVSSDIERVQSLISHYSNYIKKITNNSEYDLYLEELYSQYQYRPYACILMYNYYNIKSDTIKCYELISEMEQYLDNFEIIKFLHKFYGNQLFDPNIRIKFMLLSNNNPILEKDNPLRFNFFYFVAESYNYHFNDGRNYLNNLKFNNSNPEFHLIWKDDKGDDLIFDAIVVQKNEFTKSIKISDIQHKFRLKRGNYDELSVNSNVKVKLHFHLFGIIAQIVETS